MKQQDGSKPRIIELSKADSTPLLTTHGLNISIHPDGRIEVTDAENGETIEGATLTRYFLDDKGKMKRDFSIGNPEFGFSENQLIEKYGIVYCCDTNTRDTEVDGIKYSIGFAYKIEKKNELSLEATPYYAMFWLWRKEGINIERYSWANVINYIVNTEGRKEKICMIVDSDLKDLEEISAKRQPIAESFYMPNASKLVYASSDRGAGWMNKVMKKCDKMSRKYLDEVEPKDELLERLNSEETFVKLGIEFPPDRIKF